MRATEHASRDPLYLVECRHGLAEIIERGAVVSVNRLRVKRPHPERNVMILSMNALRHGYRFAQQKFGFFKALYTNNEWQIGLA